MNYRNYLGHDKPEWSVKCETANGIWEKIEDVTLEKAMDFYIHNGKIGIPPVLYAKNKHGDYTKFEVHKRLNDV